MPSVVGAVKFCCKIWKKKCFVTEGSHQRCLQLGRAELLGVPNRGNTLLLYMQTVEKKKDSVSVGFIQKNCTSTCRNCITDGFVQLAFSSPSGAGPARAVGLAVKCDPLFIHVYMYINIHVTFLALIAVSCCSIRQKIKS